VLKPCGKVRVGTGLGGFKCCKIFFAADVDFEKNAATIRYNRQGGLITMQYLLLIYDNEAAKGLLPEQELGKLYQDYGTFTKEIIASGHFVGANPLQPIAKATTVRVRNGKQSVTDGPFAETKEQLGGYYLVEAKDLDEAILLAARVPSSKYGSIEVRPIAAMTHS
jgi:hypothetical protein